MKPPVVLMPGKLGDMLLSVPTMRELARIYRSPIDLATTPFCRPALPLLLEEPGLLNTVSVYEQYKPIASEPGLQPRAFPLPQSLTDNGHRDRFAIGLTRHALPHERLPETFGAPYGIQVKPGPWLRPVRIDRGGPVAMAAPVLATLDRSWGPLSGQMWARPVLRALLDRLTGREIRLIGTSLEFCEFQRMQLDARPGVRLCEVNDLLDVWKYMDGCAAFVGVASAPAVLAAGVGLACQWVMHPAKNEDQRAVIERAVPRGCDVRVLRNVA